LSIVATLAKTSLFATIGPFFRQGPHCVRRLLLILLFTVFALSGCGGGGTDEPVVATQSLLIVGDSLTGEGSEDLDFWLDYFDERAYTELRRNGLSGDTLSRFFNGSGVWIDRGVVERLRSILVTEGGADIAIVQGGSNDFGPFDMPPGRLRFAMADVLNQLYNIAGLDGAVLWTLHFTNRVDLSGRDADRLAFNQWLEAVCRRNGVALFDLDGLLSPNYPRWYRDGVHPNATAASRIASEVTEILEDLPVLSLRPPSLEQAGASWNRAVRDYDGLNVTGRTAEIQRATTELEVLPASGRMPATGKYYAELLVTFADPTPAARIGWASEARQDPGWESKLGSALSDPLPAISVRKRALHYGGVRYLQPAVPDANLQAGETIMLAWDGEASTVWLGWQGQWFSPTGIAEAEDPALSLGGFPVTGDALNGLIIAIQTTGSAVTVEFAEQIPAERIPAGFSVFSG